MSSDHAPSSLPRDAAAVSPPSRNGEGTPTSTATILGVRTDTAPGTAGVERLVPMFNERFLFDDEVGDDSAFVRKYNLSADDDEFPVLLKTQGPAVSQPPTAAQLSSFVSALDLAPMPPPSGARSAEVGTSPAPGAPSSLSPWLHSTQQFSDCMDSSSAQTHSPSFPGLAPIGGGSSLRLHDKSPSARPFPELFDESRGTGLPTAGLSGFPSALPTLAVGARPPSFHNATSGMVMPTAATAPPSLSASLDMSPASTQPAPHSDASEAPRYGRFPRKDERRKTSRAFSDESEHGFSGRGMRRSDVDLSMMQLEDLRGEISQLCRDQFGCRFLQKKLDENVPSQCDLIFTETFPYFAELMTDPFGNYLCQKLLEYCTDAQRDQIVEAIAKDLVTISLNMHGTRAVQKTIDFISTSAQTEAIIGAFSRNVVTLIKDLNGNHVIQKCLNRLSSTDNQFIYDAVAAKCVDVATHRHGCCVLQRCIDHASDAQRNQLVQEITVYSLTLVQDPFGNYVVQYVLDLNDSAFNQSVTQQFLGHVCQLSTQKFSSNVIEKCIRVADTDLRQQLVSELTDATRLESLLRDSFANYVVQTCLDYAEPNQRVQLVECIRPILPAIRNTPYGKRIQSKLQRDGSEPPRFRRGQGQHHGAPDASRGPGGGATAFHGASGRAGLRSTGASSLAPGSTRLPRGAAAPGAMRKQAEAGLFPPAVPSDSAPDMTASLYAPLRGMQLSGSGMPKYDRLPEEFAAMAAPRTAPGPGPW